MFVSQPRLSYAVETLRMKTPYVAFGSRIHENPSHEHSYHDYPPYGHAQSTQKRPESSHLTAVQHSNLVTDVTDSNPLVSSVSSAHGGSWIVNDGYGARHVWDIAPFSLWDSASQDFRLPSPEESLWIVNQFNAVEVSYIFPEIIIQTPSPPTPVPLTVGGVAALFLPVGFQYKYLTENTNFANPRVPDPTPEIKLKKWQLPNQAERIAIYTALEKLATVKAINYIPPIIYVELETTDGRLYERHSLPGRVGGLTTVYHHSEKSFFTLRNQSRERLVDPGDSVEDKTNYHTEWKVLCPGVRVESGLKRRDGGYMTQTMATTAGVLLRSSTPTISPKLTVANHGFLETDDVYHPTMDGIRIGKIVERFEALDIALVQLYTSVTFTNDEYFEAQRPRKLMRSTEVSNKLGAWCSLDSMTSGLVFMRIAGIRDRLTIRPSGVTIPFTELCTENIIRCMGPTGGKVTAGICGAAIVMDDPENAGVIGFFQLGDKNSDWATCPCLDDLIDSGWSLA